MSLQILPLFPLDGHDRVSYCGSHNYLLALYGGVVGGVEVQEPQPRQAKQDGSWILRERGWRGEEKSRLPT